MKSLMKRKASRVALVLALGVALAAGGAWAAEEMGIGKSLDPVQGTIFTINDASIVNAAWTPKSTQRMMRGSRIGPQLHRLFLNSAGRLNAEDTWNKYQ